MIKKFTLFAAWVMLSLALSACVTSKPSKTTNTVTELATISFELADKDASQPIGVYLNGLYLGDARDFQTGRTQLEVAPGTHQLQLQQNNRIIFDKKIFTAKGVNKSIRI